MEFDECLRRTRYRVYRVWLQWLDKQWDQPDRHDWYLMQVAAEARRHVAKDPSQPEPSQMKLRFTRGTRAGTKAMTEDDIKRRMAQSKAAWMAGLGVGAKRSNKQVRRRP